MVPSLQQERERKNFFCSKFSPTEGRKEGMGFRAWSADLIALIKLNRVEAGYEAAGCKFNSVENSHILVPECSLSVYMVTLQNE